jgi:hypothetical protein
MEESKIEQNLNDLIEIVGSIKDNMATKDDIISIRSEMATKDDIIAIRSEMATKKDVISLRSEMIDKLAMSEYNMKVYIDDKLADQTAEMGDRIDRAMGGQKKFNAELIDGIEKHSLFEAERIEKLKSLTV